MGKNKSILLVAHHAYFPGSMGHTRQIVAMLSAISKLERTTVCLLPRTVLWQKKFNFLNHLEQSYGVKIDLKARSVPVLPFRDEHQIGWRKFYNYFALRINSFLFSISVLISKERSQADLIYTRHLLLAYFLSFSPKFCNRIVTEIHDLPETRWEIHKIRRLLKSSSRIGVISKGLAKRVASLSPEAKGKLILVPDAVSQAFVDAITSKEEARRVLKIPSEGIIVTYCGSLHSFCAPESIISAFRSLVLNIPCCTGWIVGGHPEQLNALKSRFGDINNIHFWGMHPHHKVPTFLSASDILVVSYAPWHKRQAEMASPLKIYEYIAACRPIVAPALPSVEEILTDNETALLYKAEDAEHLAYCLQKLIHDPSLGERLASQARNKYAGWMWTTRAKKLLG